MATRPLSTSKADTPFATPIGDEDESDYVERTLSAINEQLLAAGAARSNGDLVRSNCLTARLMDLIAQLPVASRKQCDTRTPLVTVSELA